MQADVLGEVAQLPQAVSARLELALGRDGHAGADGRHGGLGRRRSERTIAGAALLALGVVWSTRSCKRKSAQEGRTRPCPEETPRRCRGGGAGW